MKKRCLCLAGLLTGVFAVIAIAGQLRGGHNAKIEYIVEQTGFDCLDHAKLTVCRQTIGRDWSLFAAFDLTDAQYGAVNADGQWEDFAMIDRHGPLFNRLRPELRKIEKGVYRLFSVSGGYRDFQIAVLGPGQELSFYEFHS